MDNYRESSKPLQKRSKFNKEELRAYQAHFDVFDLNKDGVISAGELYKVSRHMGYRLSKSEVKDIMKAADVDESGALSFEEFMMVMPGNSDIPSDEHKAAEIRYKFMEYDRDQNGHVSVKEAHEILQREMAFNPEQTVQMVEKYDKNGDGQLSYEEFVDFYKKICRRADQLRDLFLEFDSDHSGAVSVDEARYMLDKLEIPHDEIEALIDIHDKNRDGELQYEEFVSFLLNT